MVKFRETVYTAVSLSLLPVTLLPPHLSPRVDSLTVSKMSTKALIRAGQSLASRILTKPLVQQSASSNERIALTNFDIAPRLFPSMSKFENPLQFHQNDADTISKVSSEGFLYPCGLPSLRFFFPDGTLLSLSYLHLWQCHFRISKLVTLG